MQNFILQINTFLIELQEILGLNDILTCSF